MELGIKGKKIIDVRQMSDAEMEEEGWDTRAIVLVLDDGTILYPSKDEEGNDAGALFGTKDKKSFIVYLED